VVVGGFMYMRRRRKELATAESNVLR
jgi:hypothetical protein